MKEEEVPRETPEESRDDENSSSKLANQSAKDRKCQYCDQAFTSSSLGRHLDQFLFKKKPDGIHDVEEIRRIRSGITRRQARTASGKRDDSPDSTPKKGPLDTYATGESSSKSRDAPVRMMFNTPTWHATGVINDIPNPNPSRPLEGPRATPSQSRSASLQLPDYASRGATANNPDTMKALELALREVLDNIKAATYALPHPSRITELTNSLIVLDFAPVCPRSTSTYKPKPSLRSAYIFFLLPRACSAPSHFPHRHLSLYSLLAQNMWKFFDKHSGPKFRNGSLTRSPPIPPAIPDI